MLKRIISMRKPGPLRIIPAGWREVAPPIPGEIRTYINGWGLAVSISIDGMDDKNVFFHLSVSHKKRLPTWNEMRDVKNLFIGHEEEAFQFFPKESEYVNLCENCLHIWKLLEG